MIHFPDSNPIGRKTETRPKYNKGKSGRVRALTDNQVRAIRLARKQGHTLAWLAEKFNVGECTISNVVNRKRAYSE